MPPTSFDARLAENLLSGFGLGAWSWNIRDKTVVWSAELREIYGVPHDHAIEPCVAKFAQFIHPDDRAEALAVVSRTLHERRPKHEHSFRIVRPDGGERQILSRAHLELDEDGEPLRLFGVDVDLTDAALNVDLRESYALIDSLFANAPIGIGFWDRDFRFARLNQRLTDINGLPLEAHIGKQPAELLPDLQGLSTILDLWRRILESGEVVRDYEIVGSTPAHPEDVHIWSESFFPVRLGSKIVGIGAVVEDVTEKRALQDDLATALMQLRLAQRAGGIAAWDMNMETGEMHWSGMMIELFNCAPVQPLRRADLMKAVHESDRGRVRDCLTAAATCEGPFFVQFRVTDPHGRLRWLECRGERYRPDPAQALRVIGVTIDITEQKLAEERLHTVAQELNHRSRNVFTIFHLLINQTARHHGAHSFAEALSARLKALQSSQDILVSESGREADLRTLVIRQLDYLALRQRERVMISGPHLTLGPAAAQVIGMAIHEMATNAMKYGALQNDAGFVEISWRLEHDMQRIALQWVESGGPPVLAPKRKGFGATVIRRLAASTLKGSVETRYPPEGFRWRLVCPLAELQREQ